MKRAVILFSILFLNFGAILSAQTINDALMLSSRYYDGTARSLGFGNAMTALGGDLGALSYNPAASGVYKYSEVAITPGLNGFTGRAGYLGNNTNSGMTRFVLSNVGWVGGMATGRNRGIVNVNFAITVNQANNFAYRMSASGVEAATSFLGSLAAHIPEKVTGDDLTMPEGNPNSPFSRGIANTTAILGWNTGLIDVVEGADGFYGATENVLKKGDKTVREVPGNLKQDYLKERTGYVEDVIFNISGNLNDRFFFGANVTIQSIWMSEYSSYSETAENPAVFQTGFTDFTSEYDYSISGLGVKLDAGIIAHPFAGLTIGASISTPTWMFLDDSYNERLAGNTKQYGSNYLKFSSAGAFRITSPFRFNVGAGYTFGKYLALGVDYERADYTHITMMDSYGSNSSYSYENDDITQYFRAVNNVRAGLELRAIPQTSIRLGYNYCQSPYQGDRYEDRHYASVGLGFRSKSGGFFIDAAYQQQCNFNESSSKIYDDYAGLAAPVMTEKGRAWKVLLTLGLRF